MPRISVRSRSLIAAALLVSGCGSNPAPPPALPAAPPPEPLGATEVATAASLLRLEDRRELVGTSALQPELRDSVIYTAARAPQPFLRARAARAAGRIGTVEGRTLVRRLLADSDTSVLAAAAFAAGELGDTSTIAVLSSFLADSLAVVQPTVAVEAAEALGKMTGAPSREALSAFLLRADTSDVSLRPAVGAALVALWRAGETAVAPFASWVGSSDPEIRWRAAYGLTRRARPESVELVINLIGDPEPLVRSTAVRGLTAPLVTAAGGSPDLVLPRLIALLADSSYSVRMETIRVLGSYPAPGSIAALLGLLNGGGPHERVAAIEALGQMGSGASGAAGTLSQLVLSGTESVYFREVAIPALQAIDTATAASVRPALMRDPSWRLRAALANSLVPLQVAAIPTLETLARDEDPRVAAAALQAAIGALRLNTMPMIRPLLLESLQNDDPYVRAAALQGFSWLADPTTFPLLLDAYDRAEDDEHNDAALAAVDAIAELAIDGGIQPDRAFFARFRRSPDYLVRQRAATRFRDAARAAWGEVTPAESRFDIPFRQLIEDWSAPAQPEAARPRFRIETDEGTIEVELFGQEAPVTTGNFQRLAREGFFDGQEWPRVVPNFVVQGGDPRGDTSGGPGYTIRDEINRHRFEAGTLGMALSGADTGGSQFFMTLSPQPHLDGGYTVFGRVLSGHDVLERILPGQRIISVREITTTP